MRPDSFYPIFPVPLDLAHEVNLDATHSDLLYLCPQTDEEHASAGAPDPGKASCAPDVLIIPSRLKQFSKVGAYSARQFLQSLIKIHACRSWTTLSQSTRPSSRNLHMRWWNTRDILRPVQHEID